MTKYIFFAIFLVCLSILFMVIGFYLRSLSKKLDVIGIKTTGQIVDNTATSAHINNSPNKSTTLVDKVSFVTQDGKTIIIKSRVGGFPQKDNLGKDVPVIYDPLEPEKGLIDTFTERTMVQIITFVCAAGFLLTSFIFAGIYMYLKKETKI